MNKRGFHFPGFNQGGFHSRGFNEDQSTGGGGGVPAGAIQDDSSNYIKDDSGNYITGS